MVKVHTGFEVGHKFCNRLLYRVCVGWCNIKKYVTVRKEKCALSHLLNLGTFSHTFLLLWLGFLTSLPSRAKYLSHFFLQNNNPRRVVLFPLIVAESTGYWSWMWEHSTEGTPRGDKTVYSSVFPSSLVSLGWNRLYKSPKECLKYKIIFT